MFAYDDLNRLITANTGSSLWGSGTYAYDALGNLTSLSLGNSRNASFAYTGVTPKLASVTENGTTLIMTYDAAGNERTTPSLDLPATYSCRNLLTAPHGSAPCSDPLHCEGSPSEITGPADILTYDGRGVRVASLRRPDDLDFSVRRHYLYTPELQLLARVDLTTGNMDAFTWFNGHPVAQWSSSTNVFRYTFTDHLGTPIIQADTAADVVWRVEYEPYGTPYAYRAGTADEQPLRFPGQEYVATEQGTEETYNIFRWYRSGWGRYTQADPKGLRGGSNLYAYVADSPVNAIDPLGLQLYVPTYPPNTPPKNCTASSWQFVTDRTDQYGPARTLWKLVSEEPFEIASEEPEGHAGINCKCEYELAGQPDVPNYYVREKQRVVSLWFVDGRLTSYMSAISSMDHDDEGAPVKINLCSERIPAR